MWQPGKMWNKLLSTGSTKNNNNNPPCSTIDEQQQEGGMPIMQPSVSTDTPNSDNTSDAGDTFHTPPASPAKQQPQSATPKQHNISIEQNYTNQSTQYNNTQSIINNTTTATINDDNMVGRMAVATTISIATASTNTTQMRHDDMAVDEATAQLNKLSPYKARAAHSPMKSPQSQPAAKKPRATINTSVPPSSTINNVDNNKSHTSIDQVAQHLPEVHRNVDTSVFGAAVNPDHADISQLNPAMSPRTIIKGESKAAEGEWHTWEFTQSGVNQGRGRGRGGGRGRGRGGRHSGNCCNRSSTSNFTAPFLANVIYCMPN